MQLNSNTLEQRWAMLTNPVFFPVPPMCKVTEEEIQQHILLVDVLLTEAGQQLSNKEMKKCRIRFERLCLM